MEKTLDEQIDFLGETALEIAAEVVVLRKENAELRKALQKFFTWLDEGVLVRNISKDGMPDWSIRMMRFVKELSEANVLAKGREGWLLAYDITYKGFRVRGFYGEGKDEGRIEITRNGEPFKNYSYPSYRIWNIAAHFEDGIDYLLADEAAKGGE